MLLHRICVRAIACVVALVPLCAVSQPATRERANLRVPLDIPLLLSGNFGELRANHFHSGIDFKTQGRTGLPIYCAADGYVSRVLVSPWGFGKAVYVTHPQLGLVTVYGHLQSFAPFIDGTIRDMQYNSQSFALDVNFADGEIPVKRGQQIALSGNSGSSGGPHLHMDVRDAETEYALDPLYYYASAIIDKVSPEVRGLALYPREGIVDGATKPAYRSAATMSTPFRAWGRVAPAIKAYDRMTGTTNIYGVKYLTLLCDGDTIYRRVIDHVDFNRTRAVNTLVDYAGVIDSNSWYMITEQPQARPLADMITVKGDGTIDITRERDYKLVYILEDQHGNRTRVPFTIRGEKSNIIPPPGEGELAIYDRDFTLSTDDGASAFIPANTLYDDCLLSISSTDAPAGYVSRRFRVGDRHVPLAGNFTLKIPIVRDVNVSERCYTLMRLDGKSPSSVASTYTPGGVIKADVNRFGDYAVAVDTVAPEVTPLSPEKWRQRGKVTFKIADRLSGIDTYRGEIDGRWVLFEYDGKTGTLSYTIDNKRLPRRASHTVQLTVTDQAGNVTNKKRTF